MLQTADIWCEKGLCNKNLRFFTQFNRSLSRCDAFFKKELLAFRCVSAYNVGGLKRAVKKRKKEGVNT